MSKVPKLATATQVERVARLIWRIENSGMHADDKTWSRFIDRYRARAREVLDTPDGYKKGGLF